MPNVKLPTGVDLYYESHGQGEPLIFVPSTAFSGEVWKPSQMPLAQSLNIVFHDPRGCGRSTAAQNVYTIEQMAADIVALMDHLKISSAHLMGHSMGGRIALCLTQNFPGRVKSLIMAASGSGPAAREGSDCITGLPHRLVVDMVEMGFEKYVRHEVCDSDTFFTKDYRDRHPDKVAGVLQTLLGNPCQAPGVRPSLHRAPQLGRHAPSRRCQSSDVSGDRRIGYGREQPHGAVRSVGEAHPGAEMKVLKGQSHGFFWQAPEETNALILDWVKRHS